MKRKKNELSGSDGDDDSIDNNDDLQNDDDIGDMDDSGFKTVPTRHNERDRKPIRGTHQKQTRQESVCTIV